MSTKILVICRHAEILQTIVRLVNQNPAWKAAGTQTDEEALTLFQQEPYELVLLGSGIEEASEQRLLAALAAHRPDVIIIQHFGGGSGLLSNEIMAALDHRSSKD